MLGIKQPTEVILFDFGGVLAEEGFRNGLNAIALRNGLNPEEFWQQAYALTFNGGYVTGRMDEPTFWQALREQTGIKGSDANLRAEILSRFELRPWMIELVKKFKESRVRCAILSDQTNWLDELNEKYDFFQWFDRVFNSFHMGKSKQDSTIFDDIAEELQVTPEQILFIDDSSGNIERARKKGLQTVLFKDKESFMKEPCNRTFPKNYP
jgi:putative hydrolase of the HAD superfamily